MATSIKLGELLVKANVLEESQLKAALIEQKRWGGKLGDILIRMSLVTEDLIARALSKQLGIPQANIDSIQTIPPHVRAKIPLATARDLVVLPIQLRDDGKTLVVAMLEPQNVSQLDTLRALSRCRIIPQLAGRTAIARAFARFYENEGEVADVDSGFKVVDAQGRTVVKDARALAPRGAARTAGSAPAPVEAAPSPPEAPPDQAGDTLREVEDLQRKEVAALKAMVDILIEKGVFTREEYLAKVKR